MTHWTTPIALLLLGLTLACQPSSPHAPSTDTLDTTRDATRADATIDIPTDPTAFSPPPPLSVYDNSPFNANAAKTTATCLKNLGCPAHRALPMCPEDWRPTPMAQVIKDRNQLVGERVTVIGPLNYGGGCTERGCPPDVCCNGCRGEVTLGRITSRGYNGLVIQNDALENLLSCGGDDSLMCCALKAEGQPVVVTGTLFRTDSAPTDYAIGDAILCAP